MFSAARGYSFSVVVALDRGEVIRAGVVDAVHGAGLQLEQAGRAFRAPAEDQGLGLGRFAPVVRVRLQDDAVALAPLLEHVGAGADGLSVSDPRRRRSLSR